jgi:hypothetical protein
MRLPLLLIQLLLLPSLGCCAFYPNEQDAVVVAPTRRQQRQQSPLLRQQANKGRPKQKDDPVRSSSDMDRMLRDMSEEALNRQVPLNDDILSKGNVGNDIASVSTTIITIMGSQPAVLTSLWNEKEESTDNNSATDPSSQERRAFAFQRVQSQHSYILTEIQRRYPSAKLIASASKLVNVLYVEIPDLQDYDEKPWTLARSSKVKAKESDDDMKSDTIEGIISIHPHAYLDLDLNTTIPAMYENTNLATSPYCTTGKGVKVAVLDTGVDYTHAALGGVGTRDAYESAYGTHPGSRRNRQRDNLFPTPRVYRGKDFLGDLYDSSSNDDNAAVVDNDPIDGQGHGTYVAAHILAMAPDARIMAVKVCATKANRFGCPAFAILQGLEYAVDPNNDGSMTDRVDIINLSLGVSVLSAYYNELTIAVEAAFAVGVLPVVSIGNSGNRPFISGGFADSPNVLSVGATGNPRDPSRAGVMESYSSRGPGANSQLKPDLSAPSGNFAAQAGSGTGVRKVFGTSFSSPLVAGAAALLKENCKDCSPLALKSLLMNSAHRFVKANREDDTAASLSWAGAGEMRIKRALDADFFAYSMDKGNIQPSISLGVINAAMDETIQRRIRVRSISSFEDQDLDISVAWRDSSQGAGGAVKIEFNKEGDTFKLGGCNNAATVFVSFKIDASKAPANFLTTKRDPLALDRNEFDGHIIFRSAQSGKTIGVPFYMILRKASKVSLSPSTFEVDDDDNDDEVQNTGSGLDSGNDYDVNLQNRGSGVAQVDAYQLLYLDGDEVEPTFGTSNAPADIRSVGYRTLKVNKPGCTNMLEFAINLWERPQHMLPTFVTVALDVGKISSVYLVTRTRDLVVSETYVINQDGERVCTGFPGDHGVDSGNIVLRACTEHIGMDPQGNIRAGFLTFAWPEPEVSDSTPWININVPDATFSSPSQDIQPFQTMEFGVSLKKSSSSSAKLGVQFVTNAYRSEDSTGAATRETETLFFLRKGVLAPQESTPDILDFPDARTFRGPKCDWKEDACAPEPSPPIGPIPSPVRLTDFPTMQPEPTDPQEPTSDPTSLPSCPPNEVPRAPVPIPEIAPIVSFPGSGFACFDGLSTVQVEEKGAVQMQHVRIGDNVLAGNDRFESVYSFGHYAPSFLGDFLCITASSNSSVTLSKHHMVYVVSKAFVPASLVRVGDRLVDSHGANVQVVKIENVESFGAFAPFTKSGTIVVNRVLASSFIAFEESPFVGSLGRANISYQWLAHSFEFPHRLVCCYLNACRAETYSSEGISHWVETPFQWCLWLFKQGSQTRRILLAWYVIVAISFSFVEALFSVPIWVLVVICLVLTSRVVVRATTK